MCEARLGPMIFMLILFPEDFSMNTPIPPRAETIKTKAMQNWKNSRWIIIKLYMNTPKFF